ncbi:hypothetical protein ACJX0J_015345, partial [Zea mays]
STCAGNLLEGAMFGVVPSEGTRDLEEAPEVSGAASPFLRNFILKGRVARVGALNQLTVYMFSCLAGLKVPIHEFADECEHKRQKRSSNLYMPATMQHNYVGMNIFRNKITAIHEYIICGHEYIIILFLMWSKHETEPIYKVQVLPTASYI